MSDESLPVYLEKIKRIYYPDKVVLDNINLTVAEGETVGILGNNGAGKTTLIRILSTLLLPSYGIIEIFGLNPSREATQIKQLIGYLPERFSFYPNFSVIEVLEFFSRLRDHTRVDQADLRERVIKALDIDSYLHVPIRSLSKGMLHKVGLGVTLIHDPRLLILDEPTSGLDPLARIQVRKFLLDLSDDFDKTVLISSHILEDIEAVCDRVFILEKGVMLHQPLWISELKNKFDQLRRVEIRGDISSESIPDLATIDDILYFQTSSRGIDLYCHQQYVSSLSSLFSDVPPSDHTVVANPVILEDIYFLNHTKVEWMAYLS